MLKHRSVRAALSAVALLLLTGCGNAPSSSVSPDLADYSAGFQEKAASELDRLKPPCDLKYYNNRCSAVHRMIEDYLFMRDQVRAING